MLNLKRKETLAEDLAHAAETGDVEWLKSTLTAGVDVDATNIFGTTALMRASSRGDVQMVRVLLSFGADPNRIRNDKFTALALAAFFGHQGVVKCLVEHGADTNASTRFGTSPEMWAKARTFRGVARYLGDKGNEPARIKIVRDSGTVAVDDASRQDDKYSNVPRSFPSFGLSLRVALSSLVLLFVVAVAEVVIEHRQAAPATVIEVPPVNTESIPAKPAVEQSVTQPSVQTVNASVNLNHSENSGRPNSSAKSHSRVAQSRGQENEADETAVSIAQEPKGKTEVAPREPAPPPVKITVSRPVSSKLGASPTQLISSPGNEKNKSKVIQWP